MVTIRNLIRLAGISLSYWSPHINDQVTTWLESCVQDSNQENTGTALQKEDNITQEPKFKRLKNRNNLRTTGFNLCFHKEKRSVHSTFCIKEGTQANKLFVDYRRSFTIIHPINLDERVMATELKQMVEKCRNKDGRYGNIIQIIGSLPMIKLVYLMIKSNSGIPAKRVTDATLDGMSLKTLQKISQDTLSGTIKFFFVRRTLITKLSKTKLPFLAISNLREKIIQKAIEIVLTVIFEDISFDCSHEFRLSHSCHTVLKYLQHKIGNTSIYSWVVEGNIKSCFDSIPHNMILKGLKQKVDCVTTLILTKRILDAGYTLNKDLNKVGRNYAKVFKTTNLGTFQGMVLSSLSSNIVLHEFDHFINEILKKEFITGDKRKANLKYRNLRYRIKRENDLKKRRVLINNCRKVPSKDFYDPNFKRLFYVRYADDWVILVAGSLKETKVICNKIFSKLQILGLTQSMKKIRIVSLRKSQFRFLGIDFFIRRNTNQCYKPVSLVSKNNTTRQRFAPRIILQVPIREILEKLKGRGFVKRSKKGEFFPTGKSNCISLTHPQILNYFNTRIQGILSYYNCVHNRNELWSIFRFVKYSCALTLTIKFKLKSLAKTFKKFGRDLEFKNKTGKIYKFFRPVNLKMLSIKERLKINRNMIPLINY